MIEKIVLDYLNRYLECPAYMEQPEESPERYVLIEKTGGSRENFINHATFAVQSYAESLFHAAQLNEIVKRTMDCMPEFEDVASARYNADYNFTDITKKEYRYQCVYDITY